MKTITTKFTIILFTAVLAITGAACNNEDDIEHLILFNDIELSGENQVPSATTTGSGTFTGSYNDDTNILSYDIDWTLDEQSTTTTAIRFHGPAASNASGPVIIEITDFDTGTTGDMMGSTRPLTQAEEDNLKAGLWYISIYSDAFPDGELRGNIVQ